MSAGCGAGLKLKPMLIFKRKTIPKINNNHGVVVSAQEKGWMDSEQMKVWIEKVWRARIGGLGRRVRIIHGRALYTGKYGKHHPRINPVPHQKNAVFTRG